jgi:GABA permease
VIQLWTAIEPGKSPFVATLEHIGIPGAGTILTCVILVAVLSVLNAGLYTSSRLLFVLSARGEAPAWIARVNGRGVPVAGVVASTLVGYACVVIAALWPDTVFLFLINSSGAVFLFVYLMICLSQIRLRPVWEREGVLKFRMWGHPWLPILVTGVVVAVLVSMAIDPTTQVSLMQSLLAWIVILAAFGVVRLVKSRTALQGEIPEGAAAAEGNL